MERGRQFQWEDIAAAHPDYDEGIEWAAHQLAHSTEEDPDAESGPGHLDFHKKTVPLDKVKHTAGEPGEWRVARPLAGFRERRTDIPPVVLVHRGDDYEVADGHHRVTAAHLAGLTHIKAYVAESPHKTPYKSPDY